LFVYLFLECKDKERTLIYIGCETYPLPMY
jgi:hypothetical protein